ncbi:protein far1-related sequence 11-like [Gigaspora margarita]|uniref:Protein far1-related sequence 11-like n=1 Tax=Gigaspora margarita TaxID=4874 RepID=A0A8H3X2G3_GIGMA|nr:protein far1-related sequence 11-like [Gigaspora margarita]
MFGDEILSASSLYTFNDMLDDEVLLASSSNMLDNGDKILPAFDTHNLGNKISSTSGSHVLSDEKLSDFGSQVLSNGFVLIIVGSESDDNTHRRCQYACEHQDIDCSKKIAIVKNQKQSQTKRLGYKWLVNATCPKSIEEIKITSCYLEHTNYEIHSDTIVFASHYRQFPDEVKESIKYYTLKGINM